MHITPRLESKINELMKVLQTNRKIFSLIEQYEYINEDGNKFIFDTKGMDRIESFIHEKIENAGDTRYSSDDEPMGIISKYIEHNIIPANELQLENPENLTKAKATGLYKVINDVVYWWDEEKEHGNVIKHGIDFNEAIKLFTQQMPNKSKEELAYAYGKDNALYVENYEKYYTIHYLKTIIDDLHKNTTPLLCRDGKRRPETNFARYVLSFDEKNEPFVSKIVYNLRYNQYDEKHRWVIKFITVYDDKNPPKKIQTLCNNKLISLGEPILFKRRSTNNHQSYKQRMITTMKFKNTITNETVDFSDRDPKTITLNEIKEYEALDKYSFKLKMSLIHKWNEQRYDYDKIVPEYDELLVGGTWQGYYGERPLTEIEWHRREKYYNSNREIFNKYLDIARQTDPNFVENRYDDYICTRDTITYGGPQSTVRKRMHLLFGNKVLTELMKEDPSDRQQDMFLNEWRMYPEDEGDY